METHVSVVDATGQRQELTLPRGPATTVLEVKQLLQVLTHVPAAAFHLRVQPQASELRDTMTLQWLGHPSTLFLQTDDTDTVLVIRFLEELSNQGQASTLTKRPLVGRTRKLGREATMMLYPLLLDLKFGNCALDFAFQNLFETFCSGTFCPEQVDYDDIVQGVVAQFVQCMEHHAQPLFVVPLAHCRFDRLEYRTREYPQEQKCHANLLLYRRATHTLEQFEPMGSETFIAPLQARLEDLVEKINQTWNHQPPLRLESVTNTCPFFGLQKLQETIADKSINEHDLCVFWTMLLARLALMAPQLSLAQIQQLVMKVSRGSPDELRNVVFGFLERASQELQLFTQTLLRNTRFEADWQALQELVNATNKVIHVNPHADPYSLLLHRMEEYQKDYLPQMRVSRGQARQSVLALIQQQVHQVDQVLVQLAREKQDLQDQIMKRLSGSNQSAAAAAVMDNMDLDLDLDMDQEDEGTDVETATMVVEEAAGLDDLQIQQKVHEFEMVTLYLQKEELQANLRLLTTAPHQRAGRHRTRRPCRKRLQTMKKTDLKAPLATR